MRAFKGLLKPARDETLSSWLSRMCHKYYFERDFESECIRLAASDPYAKGEVDLLYKSPTFLANFTPGQRSDIVAEFGVVESALTPAGFDKYCPECFREDIASGEAPSWRKAWRTRGACVCVLHSQSVLLSRLVERARDTRSRAWQAFQEHLDSPASRLNIDFPLISASPKAALANNRKLLLLTKRVQIWYHSMTCDGDRSGGDLQFLMGLWLHQSAAPSLSPGIARTYFHRTSRNQYRLNPAERLTTPAASIDTASPRELAVAYWLLGVACGVISREEALTIQRITRPDFSVFPDSQMQTAASTTRNYLDDGLTRLIGEGQECLSADDFRNISWVFVRLLTPKGHPVVQAKRLARPSTRISTRQR